MKLVGLVTGEYEGNRYAKMIFTEKMERAGCYGINAVISKANFQYVVTEILPMWDQYEGQEVRAYYDRFGKVSEISLI